MLTKIKSPKTSKHLGSLLILSTLMAIVSQFFAATPTKSQQQCPVCEYNGSCYDTDAKVDNLVCMPDGTWKPYN